MPIIFHVVRSQPERLWEQDAWKFSYERATKGLTCLALEHHVLELHVGWLIKGPACLAPEPPEDVRAEAAERVQTWLMDEGDLVADYVAMDEARAARVRGWRRSRGKVNA